MVTTKAPGPALAAGVARAGPLPGPAPVLVIDDEPSGAETTCGWLADAGYPTACEIDGADAREPGAGPGSDRRGP